MPMSLADWSRETPRALSQVVALPATFHALSPGRCFACHLAPAKRMSSGRGPLALRADACTHKAATS